MEGWVIIVDADTTVLEDAGRVLSENGIRVTALQSGQALLDYLKKNPNASPSLILMDLNMPEMDGFETLNRLREQEKGRAEIPVIFLSSDQALTSETAGLRLGAMDFIRKPFAPDVLISRVENALRTQEKLVQFEREAMIDSMTGFLNKTTAEDTIRDICATDTGMLCIMDLDSFKLINDLCGHDIGDRVLVLFAKLLRKNMRAEDVCGRFGGDEFILFARNMRTERELFHFTKRINKDYEDMMKEVLGEQRVIPTGISIGAAAVPAHGREYEKLFHLADQALSTVKQNGKHNCALSGGLQSRIKDSGGALTLESVTKILEERNISSNAMWMGREAFINIYRYMIRYMERYHGIAYRALITVNALSEAMDEEERPEIMACFRRMILKSLRNSDVMVEVSDNQIFLLLPEAHETGINVVIERLTSNWKKTEYYDRTVITWETGQVHLAAGEDRKTEPGDEPWVAVADGDAAALEAVEGILGGAQMKVTALHSGEEVMEFVKTMHPDLILLDEKLPGTDGFETLRRLKAGPSESRTIPVIFTASDETPEIVTRALQLGAEDFIKKPCIPEILTLRVRHAIERIRMQRNLSE